MRSEEFCITGPFICMRTNRHNVPNFVLPKRTVGVLELRVVECSLMTLVSIHQRRSLKTSPFTTTIQFHTVGAVSARSSSDDSSDSVIKDKPSQFWQEPRAGVGRLRVTHGATWKVHRPNCDNSHPFFACVRQELQFKNCATSSTSTPAVSLNRSCNRRPFKLRE